MVARTQPTAKKAAAGTAKKAAGATKKAAPRSRPALPPQIVPVGTGSAAHVRLLVYGPPGTGKTVLAGTSPRALIAEADRGDESAAIRGSTAQKWVIDDWDDIEAFLDYLRSGGVNEWDWVWLDSVTLFQERGLDNIMEDLHADKPHRKVWAPDKGEYGQNMNRLSKWMREFTRLGVNVGVTAHVRRVEDYEDGVTTYMPYVQGKDMPEKVCAYFGLVGHMSTIIEEGKEIPVFSTRKDQKFYTKDRFGVIGRMKDPTIPKIMARIEKARANGIDVNAPIPEDEPPRARKATAKRSAS